MNRLESQYRENVRHTISFWLILPPTLTVEHPQKKWISRNACRTPTEKMNFKKYRIISYQTIQPSGKRKGTWLAPCNICPLVYKKQGQKAAVPTHRVTRSQQRLFNRKWVGKSLRRCHTIAVHELRKPNMKMINGRWQFTHGESGEDG